MARIWSSGFELNSPSIESQAGTQSAGSATVTTQTTIVRSGTYALQYTHGTAGAAEVDFTVPTMVSGRTYYARVYFCYTALPSQNMIILWTQGNGGGEIFLNTDGTLSLARWSNDAILGGKSAVLKTNQWYRVELLYTFTSGFTAGYLDGFQFANGTGDLSGAITAVSVGVAGPNSDSTCIAYFDDLALNDDQGSFQNGLPGPGKIIHLKPSAAGDANTFGTQTGGTAGAANNFTRVNEVQPDGATTFNGSNTANQEDLYNVDDSGINDQDTVNVVQVGMYYAGSSTTSTATVKLEIEKKASGTITQSAGVAPNATSYKINANAAPRAYPLTLYQDPDSVNWNNQTLNSMQIGMKITTGSTNRADISTIWALVEYVPVKNRIANYGPYFNTGGMSRSEIAN